MTIRFDDSIAGFIPLLQQVFSDSQIQSGTVLRDASGRLAFISLVPVGDGERKKIVDLLEKVMPNYARSGSCVLEAAAPGVAQLLEGAILLTETYFPDEGACIPIKLIDRRIVGRDWLATPVAGWQPPQAGRLVFSSMKGGVGRSTALAVLAAELARVGKKVLVIDLDLEAPGIGSMLLPSQDRPRYGVLDWYVESGVNGSPATEMASDLISACTFGDGRGLIDVAPAVGSTTDASPHNYLSKLARAYLDATQGDQPPLSFLAMTSLLVDTLSSQKRYDAILIDARAGLNETTPAALLGLGADILFFGIDTPQTFASYAYLFAHLRRIMEPLGPEKAEDWLYRLRMIHAKASANVESQDEFRDRSFELFSKFLYKDKPVESEQGGPLVDPKTGEPTKTQQFGLEDREAPHFAWPILSDSNFAEFDPIANPSQLSTEMCARTYGAFFSNVLNLVG